MLNLEVVAVGMIVVVAGVVFKTLNIEIVVVGTSIVVVVVGRSVGRSVGQSVSR